MNHKSAHSHLCACAQSISLIAILALALPARAQSSSSLSPKWEELTAPDFVQAIHQSQGVCVLPFGIIEKHGPHLPLGTDLLDVRYAVVQRRQAGIRRRLPRVLLRPDLRSRQQPGTLAYSLSTQLTLLQETVNEMARNGCKKIVIVNGHGGNEILLPLFAQSQLASQRDYVVYVFGLPNENVPGRPALKTTVDMHAGEVETSNMLIARPDLVHHGSRQPAIRRRPAPPESARLRLHRHLVVRAIPRSLLRATARPPTKNWAQFDQKAWSKQIADAIKAIKADDESLKLQNQFFEDAKHPLDTKQ